MKAPILALLLLAPLAHASSDQAWAEHDKQLLKACTAASQLKDVRALGKSAEFDDRSGYSALLLQGRYPQKHMNNRKGSELCLYDRRQKTAYVTEWTPGKP
ncbi:hypothetical protein V0R50_29060 [Pseudomonas sp. 148P]|uniref:Secreted protein n=1 Tax=Pseudomonas ulcerans TaxID=3115852 RepID=A0ABU7I0V1_9PSED|nr:MULTISPECIES: hypothetical protein [unclassified Pseudomonas]MEE1926048.1 hypothetical protein [Pseudomonas sp. 147P]MEE1937293.1 hypothetical protein [Pseudomonas sp. 148P]